MAPYVLHCLGTREEEQDLPPQRPFLSLARCGANLRQMASVEDIRWDSLWGLAPRRWDKRMTSTCEPPNMASNTSWADGQGVQMELSLYYGQGWTLTPLTHSDSHHLWEGLTNFQLWERNVAGSCNGGEDWEWGLPWEVEGQELMSALPSDITDQEGHSVTEKWEMWTHVPPL